MSSKPISSTRGSEVPQARLELLHGVSISEARLLHHEARLHARLTAACASGTYGAWAGGGVAGLACIELRPARACATFLPLGCPQCRQKLASAAMELLQRGHNSSQGIITSLAPQVAGLLTLLGPQFSAHAHCHPQAALLSTKLGKAQGRRWQAAVT